MELPKFLINPNVEFHRGSGPRPYFPTINFDPFELALEAIRSLKDNKGAILPLFELIKIGFHQSDGKNPNLLVEGVLLEKFGIKDNLHGRVDIPSDQKEQKQAVSLIGINFGRGYNASIESKVRVFEDRVRSLRSLEEMLPKS